jgi:proteasome lid subunit RPN8/RPN11
MPLLLTERSMGLIHGLARRNPTLEVMGILTSASDSPTITDAYVLPAEASNSHAEAAPLAIREAAVRIRNAGQVPRGLFHSHANHGVFHSSTDCRTIERLLPALADWYFEPPSAPTPPAVTSAHLAELQLPDGRVMRFELCPDGIAVVPIDTLPLWTGIQYSRSPESGCVAKQDARTLVLESAGVKVSLGLPDESILISRIDPPAARISRLFSLVVNAKGASEAKCLIVAEIGAETFLRFDPCEITTVAGEPNRSSAGFFLADVASGGPS